MINSKLVENKYLEEIKMKTFKSLLIIGLFLLLASCKWDSGGSTDVTPQPDPGPKLKAIDTTKRIVRDLPTNLPIYEFKFTQYQYDTKDELFLEIKNISLISRPFTYQITVKGTNTGRLIYSYEDYNPGVAPGYITEPLFISSTPVLLSYHDIWISMQYY